MSGGGNLTGQSVDQARRALTATLKANGIESPELDARLLAGAALDLDLTGLMRAGERVLTPAESEKIDAFARRRISGEPVARILGHKEFWGLSLAVSPATLIPRPDTETLIEAALDILRRDHAAHQAVRIADIGTGSGAILLALLSELRGATGVGTDISHEALATARHNAARLGLEDRASFIECDYASALSGEFDVIVSNPPYIPSSEIRGLAIEVRDHDPHLALDGGADGLEAYRAIAPAAFHLLAPGGALIFEVGQGQDGDVNRIMAAVGFAADQPPKADLSGVNRVVVGRKTPLKRPF